MSPKNEDATREIGTAGGGRRIKSIRPFRRPRGEAAARASEEGEVTKYAVAPTGRERTFGEEEIIVSKTDSTGRISYANDVFLRVAGFTEDEVIGQPHSLVRHPDMPRAVFKLLWDTIQSGREIFAYVVNMAKNGDHYWVFAHVTPSFDQAGNVAGFHSNRRKPDPAQIVKIQSIYAPLLAEETRHSDRKEGMRASHGRLLNLLEEKGVTYEELIFSL